MDYGPIVEAQKLLTWQKKVAEMARMKENEERKEKEKLATRNNASYEDGAIVSTKFTNSKLDWYKSSLVQSYGYIKRKQVEEFLSIIAEKLNTDITSVWLSNDGDGICDLREFVVNIFTFRPKLIVSALKEASSLDHLNGHYLSRSYPVTQDMKDVMNDEKRSLRTYLLGKNLNNGQIVSLFPAIDAGITSKKIIDGINKLGNATLSKKHLPKWKKIGGSWKLNFMVTNNIREDTSEVVDTLVENDSVQVPIVNFEGDYGGLSSCGEGYPCSSSVTGCNEDLSLAQIDISCYEGSCSGAGGYEGLRSGGESYGCASSGVGYLDSSCGGVDYGGLSFGGGNYGGSSYYTGDLGGSCSGGGDFGGFGGF